MRNSRRDATRRISIRVRILRIYHKWTIAIEWNRYESLSRVPFLFSCAANLSIVPDFRDEGESVCVD